MRGHINAGDALNAAHFRIQDLEEENRRLQRENAELLTLATIAEKTASLLHRELENIANAKPDDWADEFQAWAQSRARHTLTKTQCPHTALASCPSPRTNAGSPASWGGPASLCRTTQPSGTTPAPMAAPAAGSGVALRSANSEPKPF